MRNVPKWAKGNAFAKRFFKWLRKKNNPALLTGDAVFTKVSSRGFTFVYMGPDMENRASHLYQGMDFVGLFNQKTFEFTDVAYSLRTLLNIPEGKKFRFQRGCMHCLEHKVQEYAQKKLEKENKEISITAVERAAVAWKYRELIEQAAGDVIFEKTSVMEALRQTNYVKSIVTAQGQMDLERKGKQSYQGWMYARLLAFSNGNLQALYDRSDGFYRRQLILTTKDKPLSRVDDPDIAEKMAAEVEGILLWAFEGLQRLVKNGFQFTESDRAKRNWELVKRDNNNVFDFLESEGYIRLKADACTSSKELYEVYRMWCEENSLNAIKARGFSDALIANQRRYNLESTNNIVNSSGRRVRGFVGIEALVQPDLTPNSWRV